MPRELRFNRRAADHALGGRLRAGAVRGVRRKAFAMHQLLADRCDSGRIAEACGWSAT